MTLIWALSTDMWGFGRSRLDKDGHRMVPIGVVEKPMRRTNDDGTVREAYVQGVSTRRVDDLVKALGLDGISKSQVSLLCQELDTEVERFRTRKLEGTYPYVWVDATFVKARQEHRVVNMAVVIAVGLNAATGQREVLGVDVGPSEDGAFWLGFLRGLVSRGLTGVQLVTSDSHQGLKGATAAVLQGASWQRCRTHSASSRRSSAMVNASCSPSFT
jgi:transposase-like protein